MKPFRVSGFNPPLKGFQVWFNPLLKPFGGIFNPPFSIFRAEDRRTPIFNLRPSAPKIEEWAEDRTEHGRRGCDFFEDGGVLRRWGVLRSSGYEERRTSSDFLPSRAEERRTSQISPSRPKERRNPYLLLRWCRALQGWVRGVRTCQRVFAICLRMFVGVHESPLEYAGVRGCLRVSEGVRWVKGLEQDKAYFRIRPSAEYGPA